MTLIQFASSGGTEDSSSATPDPSSVIRYSGHYREDKIKNQKQCKQKDSRCFSDLTCLLLLNSQSLSCWCEVRRRRPSSGAVCSLRCYRRTAPSEPHTSDFSVHFSLVSVLDNCRQPGVENNFVYLLKYSNFRYLVLEFYNLLPISASTLAETHHVNF